MQIRPIRIGSRVVASLLITLMPALAADEGGEDASTPVHRPPESALDYQPPVYQAKTIALIEAVRITLENQPNIRLQAEDELLRAGLAQVATGQFDTTFIGSLSYDYTQQELSEGRKESEQKKRDDLLEEINTQIPLVAAGEELLAEYTSALSILEAGGDPGSISFSNPTDQAAWDVQLATLANAPPENQGDVQQTMLDWVSAQETSIGREVDYARTQLETNIDKHTKLGVAPEAEQNHNGALDLSLKKQYRSGPTITPFLSVSTSGSKYKDKPEDVEFGGKGVIDDWQTKVGFKVDIPLGRGRGRDSTAARETAANIDYEASLATTTHTASFEVLQTVSSYWSMLAAQKSLDVLERSLALNQRILELSKSMVDADEMPRAELARTLAREAEARASVEEARRSLDQARLAFVTTVGLQIAGESQAPLAADDFPRSPDMRELDGLDVGALTLFAFDERNDYKAAKLLEDSGRVLYRAATLDLRPRTDLGLELSYGGRHADNDILKGLEGAFTGDWTGPSAAMNFAVDWPIQNNVQVGRLEQQRSLYNRSAITTRDLARTIQSNIVISGETLKEAARGVQQYQEAVDFYRETVRLEVEKFQIGMSTLIDTIFTEQNQISAEIGLITSQQRYATLLAQLRYEAAMLISEQPEGWAVGEENLIALPYVAGE